MVKDRDTVELTDLPCFGTPAVLVWRKVRWGCVRGCGSFTEHAPGIAAPRLRITDRAGRWATVQVGRHGRSVTDVASDLGCGWHTVMDAVVAYGKVLVDDPDRFGTSLPSDWTRHSAVGSDSGDTSSGQPRSSMLQPASSSTWSKAAPPPGRSPGLPSEGSWLVDKATHLRAYRCSSRLVKGWMIKHLSRIEDAKRIDRCFQSAGQFETYGSQFLNQEIPLQNTYPVLARGRSTESERDVNNLPVFGLCEQFFVRRLSMVEDRWMEVSVCRVSKGGDTDSIPNGDFSYCAPPIARCTN